MMKITYKSQVQKYAEIHEWDGRWYVSLHEGAISTTSNLVGYKTKEDAQFWCNFWNEKYKKESEIEYTEDIPDGLAYLYGYIK